MRQNCQITQFKCQRTETQRNLWWVSDKISVLGQDKVFEKICQKGKYIVLNRISANFRR